jgi:hypothetical protein
MEFPNPTHEDRHARGYRDPGGLPIWECLVVVDGNRSVAASQPRAAVWKNGVEIAAPLARTDGRVIEASDRAKQRQRRYEFDLRTVILH